jgi:hypothetical protein
LPFDPLLAFIPGARPRINEAGIWTLDGRVGLGLVVLLETPNLEILVIRKAFRNGYEFSGQLALPGGMVRSNAIESNVNFAADLDRTVLDRLQHEVGISGSLLPRLEPSSITPLVTSYTARGEKRHTIVLPCQGQVTGKFPLQSQAPSVQDPEWMHWEQLASLLEETAPANRLILAHYLWKRMSPLQRNASSAKVAEAANNCRAWAFEAGLTSLSTPWPLSGQI